MSERSERTTSADEPSPASGGDDAEVEQSALSGSGTGDEQLGDATPLETAHTPDRPRSGSVGDRYGRKTTRRWMLPVLSVGVVVLGLIIAYIGYKQFGPKDIDPEQLGYTVIDDSTIEAHFKVTRTHPDQAAFCFVRAMDKDGNEVGRREVLITPSTSGTVELKTIVRSVARPAATDIYGCGGKVPAYLRAG
ncbi:DUF4307 domain-containing protein [Nocardia macrotermitis]|uniref:DUF4307 domain-containing protein n=1 Tax=Nocardia macrotermitis TaxID=2585198 RepID=A0A7K0D213_9NOCA|nr:DUF4307 domain-containing protein [Nocardia macrotermitis]MQY19755.1 hypothetical protein [Nocardia macrotermitis]